MSPPARVVRPLLTFLALGAALGVSADPADRPRKPRPESPVSVKLLDDRAATLESDYLDGLRDLADGYEAAGQIDKARSVLRQILERRPDDKDVQARLKSFDEAVFDRNQHQLEIDVARGWTMTNVMVTKGQPVRISADGTYRFIVNEALTADGFPRQDVLREMAGGVPAGALMGLVAPPPKPGQREAPAPGTPFHIGASSEFTPEETGILLLRVNLPTTHKSAGELKISISGNIRRAG
jgi:hypothetical protein